MKLFGKSKLTQEQLHRQAAEELDAAVARATPPTDAQRTWVLPAPEVPDLRPPVRRPVSRSPRPLAETEVEETAAPAQPARRRAPAAKTSRTKAAAAKPAGRARSKA
jgi:hypothetical protein